MLQYTTGRIPLQFWSMIYLLQLHDRKGGSCFLIQQRLESKRVAVRTWLLSAAQPNTSNNKHVTYQVGKENVVWRRWALPVTVFRWHMCSPSSPELRPEKDWALSLPDIECAPCIIHCQCLQSESMTAMDTGMQNTYRKGCEHDVKS